MRRKNRSVISNNHNSLLDTMTNVVGVLVIMLAVAQLSVGATVRKIKNYVEPVEEQELDRVQDVKFNQQEKLKDLEEKWAGVEQNIPAYKEDTKTLRLEIARLDKENARMKFHLEKIDTLRKKLDELQKNISELSGEKQKLADQYASVDQSLQNTPKPVETSGPYQIPLPNPAIPQFDTTPVYLYCYQGRIQFVSYRTVSSIKSRVIDIIQARFDLSQQNQSVDCDQLIELFQSDLVRDRLYHVNIGVFNGEAELVIKPREPVGEDIEQIRNTDSEYQTTLRELNPQYQYLRFYVDPASYDLYLEARKIATELSFKSGWSPLNMEGEVHDKLGQNITLSCGDYQKVELPKAPRRGGLGLTTGKFKGFKIPPEIQYNDLID